MMIINFVLAGNPKRTKIHFKFVTGIVFRGVDPGGAGGAVAPPMKILGGQTYHFAPPIISTT